MTKNFSILISVSLLLAAVLPMVFEANPEKVEVTFTFPKNKVNGSVGNFEGTIQLNRNTPHQSIVNGKVAVSSLKTGIFLRNMHLKSGSYFNESNYPTMSFNAKSINFKDEAFQVKGQLTIREQSKDVIWIFRENDRGDYLGTCEIYSSDFGISIHKNRLDNLVKIELLAPRK
jgi:polyisoprenoid-binding protein YceI